MNHSCNYCRKYGNNRKRIARVEKTLNPFYSDYIYICQKCAEERGLQNEPEYKISEVKAFVEDNHYSALMLTVLQTDGGEDYLHIETNNSQLLPREQLKFIADELYKTIGLENNLDSYVDKTNAYNLLLPFYSKHPKHKNKFFIPWDELRVSKKTFNPNKHKWGFTCGNCSEKVSIDKQKNYFSIFPTQEYKEDKIERACSIGCARVIAKDIVQKWINENSFIDYFYIDDLEQELDEYLEKV